MFKAYKEVGMEFGTDKWIGFVSDNGPDIEIWLKHNVLSTLGQVAASWVWLRGIIEKLPSSKNEWLDYQNREAPNLAELACRLFSIPPNSATSERVWSLMGEISARIIDDINVFESNNNSEPPTLLEIFNGQFNPQLIETAIVKGLDFIL
ncbi:13801_t:CDS:2 [Rhizophagus irregularis]|nr:13801_t:CDS:2 [Rhizophagus irregularis]